jgi:hypothetical protein
MTRHFRADGQIRGAVTAGPSPTKAGWSVQQWCDDVDCCRTVAYELIGSSKIKSVRLGRRRIITTSPTEFLASLDAE